MFIIKGFYKSLLILSLLLAIFPNVSIADFPNDHGKIKIYFFWGDGCPYCEEEKIFLKAIKQRYPDIEILSFEVWHNEGNFKLFDMMAKGFGIEISGVPTTFVGDAVFVGYSKKIATDIEEKIKECVRSSCIDPINAIDHPVKPKWTDKIKVPFFGEVDATKISIPTLAIVMGGLDSFNPCAFFVLLFLLSLLTHAKSRAKMFIIGGIFVFFSGFLYFLFMAAWLNLFLIVGQLNIITLTAATVAIAMALINIKDFFFFRKGISLTISDKAKPKLYERMRSLLKSTSIYSMIFGTAILAIVANTYELICTAGFPMVFTRILTLHNLTSLQYYSYLLLYNVVYVIPLLVIVFVMAITLGSRKLTEWHGRVLKLISGVMMLAMGLILLIKPTLLNNALVSLKLLLGTLIISTIIIYIYKKIKPETEIKFSQ